MTKDNHTEEEVWRKVPGYPGYEASSLGRLRSYWRPGGTERSEPVILQSSTVGPCGFRTTNCTTTVDGVRQSKSVRIGSMVALAFLGPRPEGAEVRRLDGNTLNDRLDNIAYGTAEEVAADHAARARRDEAAGSPTRCPEGHLYSDSYLGNWGKRRCNECKRQASAEWSAVNGERKRQTQAEWWAVNGEQRNARLREQSKALREVRGPRVTNCVDCQVEVVSKHVTGPLPKRCDPCRKAKRWSRDVPPWRTCPDCGFTTPREWKQKASQRCGSCSREYNRLAKRAHYHRQLEQLQELLVEKGESK